MTDTQHNEALRQKIAALEAQRALLGDAAVDAALAALRQEAPLQTTPLSPATGAPALTPGAAFEHLLGVYPTAEDTASLESRYGRALADYLAHILTTYRTLDVRGIRTDRVLSLELETVYVTLSTADPRQAEKLRSQATAPAAGDIREVHTRPLETLLAANDRLVVLGDPGSGKTTLLRYLALTCARAIAEDRPALLADRLGLASADVLLPVFLPLREFAAFVRQADHQERVGGAAPSLLLRYLSDTFRHWQLDLPADFFRHQLDAGHCLLLLDGLDEVANFDERVSVSEHVAGFVRRFPGNRFVLSSRIRGYVGPAQLAEAFQPVTILDFTDEDITQFVTNWSLAVATAAAGRITSGVRAEAARQAADLQQAVLSNPRVRALAVNPLLLTVIALVHRYRARLPESRAELYNECTEVLLGSWETGKAGEESKRLARFTGTELHLDPGEKRAFVEPIAFHMHRQGVSELDKSDLLAQLRRQFADRGHAADEARHMAQKFLDALLLRSGLLQEVEMGVYRFSHLSFQEYLAARSLADRDDFTEFAAARAADAWWKEVILLAAGHLGSMGRRRVAHLVTALKAAPDADFAGLLLAGECLMDLGSSRVDAAVWQATKDEILALIATESSATGRCRASAGAILGRLGDPREGVTTLPPLLTEITIQGEFRYGKAGELRTTRPFRAAVYPTTNAQYALFMAAGGYEEQQWWSDAGWRWRQSKPVFPWQKTDQPDFWLDRRRNNPNHPVVGVTWYEAEAFCRWLSARFEQLYRLPTEEEWEHMARGKHGRVYPWGNEWIEDACNTSELNLQQTSAVGIFPQGVSPSGAHDCAGNVWEWCNDDGAALLLCGGSYMFAKDSARLWARHYFNPPYGNFDYGFRVVAPIS